jgi:hypothetical protein
LDLSHFLQLSFNWLAVCTVTVAVHGGRNYMDDVTPANAEKIMHVYGIFSKTKKKKKKRAWHTS